MYYPFLGFLMSFHIPFLGLISTMIITRSIVYLCLNVLLLGSALAYPAPQSSLAIQSLHPRSQNPDPGALILPRVHTEGQIAAFDYHFNQYKKLLTEAKCLEAEAVSLRKSWGTHKTWISRHTNEAKNHPLIWKPAVGVYVNEKLEAAQSSRQKAEEAEKEIKDKKTKARMLRYEAYGHLTIASHNVFTPEDIAKLG